MCLVSRSLTSKVAVAVADFLSNNNEREITNKFPLSFFEPALF